MAAKLSVTTNDFMGDDDGDDDASELIGADALIAILAKRNINLNDEDKLELLDNVTVKGMKGDIDLIEELVAAKAEMMDKVTKNDEEAIMSLVQEKVTMSGISLPENIEVY
eukprot:sb/3477214/